MSQPPVVVDRPSWIGGPPWKTDREDLQRPLVERLIDEQMTELAPASARFLASGWDHDAWLVNEDWVVRFPRRAEVVPHARREVAVLERLASVDLGVPIPRIEMVAEPTAGFPYPFTAYRLIPGVPVENLTLPDGAVERIAPVYGRAVATLHALPVDDFRALGVTGEAGEPADWLRRMRDWVSVIEQRGGLPADVLDALRPLLHGDVDVPARFTGELVVLHDDLGPAHVLIDPATGEMTGIIDWTDLGIGDPLGDLAPLIYWGGPGLFRRVIKSYGPLSDSQIEHVRFTSQVSPLTWFGETLAGGNQADIADQRARLIHRVRHEHLATVGLQPARLEPPD